MNKLLKILVALSTLSFNLAEAQIIDNGSFESATVDPGNRWTGLPNGSKAIDGWMVSSGNIDYVGGLWSASEGVRSVDLNGNTTGSISQSFNTTTGVIYLVRFDLAGNLDGGSALKKVSVSAANAAQEFEFNTTGKSRQNMGWTKTSLLFTAVDTLTTLTFASLSSSAFGPAIDNVTVEIAPPPNGDAITVGVLYSFLESDTLFWRNLNANWATYGSNEIQIDYTTMRNKPVTPAALIQNNFLVLIVDDAISNSTIYTDDEVDAIKRYVEEGRGLIVTGGTLRSNGSFAPLLGYSQDVKGQVFFQTGIPDSIEFIDSSSPLFVNMSGYTNFSSNFYSGRDWANDGGLGLRSDWEHVLVDPNAELVGMIWNFVSGELRGSPISVLNNPNYRSAFAGLTPVNQVALSDDFQFVYNMIVYTSPSALVSVHDFVNNVPGRIEIAQNYPNPFNPTTTIEYQVSKASVVQLRIFNLLGQRIRTLVEERKSQGTYRIEWNGRDDSNRQVPSGLYVYRIVAGGSVQSKKMILLR